MKRLLKIIVNWVSLITLPIWVVPVVVVCSIDDGELLDHITGKKNMFWD